MFTASDFRRTTVSGQTRYRAVLDVLLPIMDDGDDEEDEDLTVVLSFVNPTLPHLQGSSATARVTIKDNDFVPVTISWDQSSYSVDEHGSTITLAGPGHNHGGQDAGVGLHRRPVSGNDC